MAKEPNRRYASARELADDLRRFLKGKAIRARPVGRVERVARWARRQPVVAGLTAATLLVTAVGVAAFAWQFWVAVAARHTAETNAQNAIAAEERERGERQAKEAALQTAEGNAERTRDVLYVTRCNLAAAALRAGDVEQVGELLTAMKPGPQERDLRGFEWFLLDRLVHGDRRTISFEKDKEPAPDEYASQVFFALDGRTALQQERDEVHVWDTATGRTTRRVPIRPGQYFWCKGYYHGQLWRSVALATVESKVLPREALLFDPVTGETRPLADPHVRFQADSRFYLLDPSGERAVLVSLPGPRAVVFNTRSGAVTAELQLPTEPLRGAPGVRWTEDGGWLLMTVFRQQAPNATAPDWERRLYDPATGKPRFPEVPRESPVTFSRNGERFAYLSREADGVVVAETATGRTVTTVSPGPEFQARVRDGDFVLSEDGQQLLVGNRLFDLEGRTSPLVLHGLRWSRYPPVSGNSTQPILPPRFPGEGSPVFQPIPAPRVDGEGRLWTFDLRGSVTVHNLHRQHFQLPSKILDTSNTVHDSKGNRSALAGIAGRHRMRDTSLWVFDLARARRDVVPLYELNEGEGYLPAISADGNRVLVQAAPQPYAEEQWSYEQRTPPLTRGQGLGVMAIQLTPAPTPTATFFRLAAAAKTGMLWPSRAPTRIESTHVRVWDVRQRRWVFDRRLPGVYEATPMCISASGQWVAVRGTAERTVHMFEVETGLEAELHGWPSEPVGDRWNTAFSRDGRRVAWAGYGIRPEQAPTPRLPTQLGVWDLSSGRREYLHRFPAEQSDCSILQMRFSPDGTRLAALLAVHPRSPARQRRPGPDFGRTMSQWWDIQPEEWTSGVQGVLKPLRLVVWRLGPRSEPAVERELDIGVWDPFLGLHEHAQSMAFSPDGTLLAGCNYLPDGLSEVRLWEVATGKLLRTLIAPGGPYRDRGGYLSFTPDGHRLFTGARLWDLATGLELLTLTEDLVGGRNESPNWAFLADGDVVRGVFTAPEDVRVYTFDGTPAKGEDGRPGR